MGPIIQPIYYHLDRTHTRSFGRETNAFVASYLTGLVIQKARYPLLQEFVTSDKITIKCEE